METAYFPKAVRWKVFGTAGKKSRNTCWITSHASKWSQLDYLVRVYYSTVLFTSWVGGWISKWLLGLQQTCILLSYLDVVPWLMPNSEGLLIERSAFSDGEETFWVFCNPSRCSLPRESQEFHLVHWEHYISVPRKMRVNCHISKDEGQQWEHTPLGLSLTNSSCVPPACLLGSL